MSDDTHVGDEAEDEMPKMWREFKREIDIRLDSIRPSRASLGEKDWREPIYGWARNHIPNETELVRYFAHDIVDQREGAATRRGNAHLRRWVEGQTPLVWDDIGCLPIKVTRDQRVRLDACTPQDMEDAAALLQDDGLKAYRATILVVEGERDLARRARDAGLIIVALLGDLPPRSEQEAA